MPTINLARVEARSRLKPRREPYWQRVAQGQYLGFRRLAGGPASGTWLARSRDPDDGKQRYMALGEFDDLPPNERHDAAMRKAAEWFKHLAAGGTVEVLTVGQACSAYVEHIRDTKGDAAADELKARFRRTVAASPLASIKLLKLTQGNVETWRKALARKPVKVNRSPDTPLVQRPRSASSVNRDTTALRAALNRALAMGHATSDAAWRTALHAVAGADRRRTVYLGKAERTRLIAEAAPDVAAFLRGLSLLPLRPGALAALRAGDFDRQLRVLVIGKDKAGAARRITLPEGTADFFALQCKDKLPAAPLLARADGKPWDKDAWKKPIKAAAIAANLPDAVTAYTIRHSVITDLIVAGLDVLTVARLSGTSIAMVDRHYGHLRAEAAAAALSALAL